MALFMFSIFCSACVPDGRISDPGFAADILPPLVQSARVVDERHIQLVFDESVHSAVEFADFAPELAVAAVETDAEILLLTLAENQIIGQDYVLRLSVEDESNNRLSLLYSFSGWNPSVPDLLINELNPQGSGSRPDCIELYVLSDGNLGGMQLTIGTEEKPKGTYIFPAVEVFAGEYIVLHTKPEGLAEEIDETDGMDASGGLLARPGARDFWMKDAPGLPGSNGAVVVYRQKSGPVIDAVLWSERTDNSADEKLGWTNESFEWARSIGMSAAWNASDAAVPLPSEAVPAGDLTATRSLGRNPGSPDTNSAADWHTSPTSGLTMGAANFDPNDIEDTGTPDPETTDPTDTEPTEPGTIDPGEPDPADPGTTDPTGTEPTEPGTIDPSETDPGDSGTTNPEPSNPALPDTGTLPKLLINELNPEGTGNNPECVEIYVVSGGNLEGIVFTVGSAAKPKAALTFPSVEVSAGDYIVVHTRYEGTGDEVDETGAIDVSGAKLATDTARDFWIQDSVGLPSTNGAVVLYARQGAEIMDAVLWTNRSDDSTHKYLGWTSASYIWAQELGNANAWEASAGGIPLPSDALAVSDSSATRSLNRKSGPKDSNSAADWYIVPTSGLTFGAANNNEVYSP